MKYYIAALPELPLNFYKNLEKLFELDCYPEVRLPFHVTLFYLGELTKKQYQEIENWFNKKKHIQKIEAKVKGINSFYKDDNPFVYFMELDSLDLERINKELEVFSHINKDHFSFIPHLSLFFPKINSKKVNINTLQKIFKNINTLSFKKIYLGSSVDNITHIHKSIPCLCTEK